jgi:hypothetical protein
LKNQLQSQTHQIQDNQHQAHQELRQVAVEQYRVEQVEEHLLLKVKYGYET